MRCYRPWVCPLYSPSLSCYTNQFLTSSLLNSLFMQFFLLILLIRIQKSLAVNNHKKCYLLVLCEVCEVFIVTSLKK